MEFRIHLLATAVGLLTQYLSEMKVHTKNSALLAKFCLLLDIILIFFLSTVQIIKMMSYLLHNHKITYR